jgi:ferric-dicitrate binding protein FerR (iron transport regulator)
VIDPADELRRKLDQVVGKRFEPEEGRDKARRAARSAVKALAAAVCAVGAAATVVWVIESHRLPKDIPRRADKPVTVTIVPAKPP